MRRGIDYGSVAPQCLFKSQVHTAGKEAMGHRVSAKCLECGKAFTVDHGGGFFFHLLRCEKCGKTKAIDFDRLGELHLRHLKGLPDAASGDAKPSSPTTPTGAQPPARPNDAAVLPALESIDLSF